MKTFLLQYGRFFLLAFFLGFLMPRLQGSALRADVTAYDSFESLDAMIVTYHEQANSITNKYIEKLLANPKPDVLYPSSTDGCREDNLSTYCLAYSLNEELVAFEQALLNRKDTLEDLGAQIEEAGGEDGESTDVFSLEDALSQSIQQNFVIEEQIKAAEDALDLSLAVYNQIQVVYPLHKEMENLHKNLENFNEALALLRSTIDLYPSRFNGATTAQCK